MKIWKTFLIFSMQAALSQKNNIVDSTWNPCLTIYFFLVVWVFERVTQKLPVVRYMKQKAIR